jgi:hypothetical protein
VLARWLAVGASALILLREGMLPAAQLMWHEVRLDSEGKLLSWVETGAPYGRIVRNAWEAFKNIPVQPDGYRTYFTHPTFYGPNDPDYRTNLNQYSPLETARYLLQHPEVDPAGTALAKDILDWVTAFFAADSMTMGGIPEKGRQWGADVLSEQVNDMDKMSSHTARYASVRALWHEVSGDQDSKERAFRSFNWATYSSRENGLVKTSLDEGTGYWFSDGYGDYMRHFLRGMASVPEWAPANEDHLLGSTSVVRSVSYGEREVTYVTFDRRSREVLRLRHQPAAVRAGTVALPRAKGLQSGSQGYSVEPVRQGGFVVRIEHHGSAKVTIQQ